MKQISSRLPNFEANLSGLAIGVCLTLILMSVFFRFLFDKAFIWSEEFSRYLMICSTYLGAAALCVERGHIRMDTLIRLLPPAVQRYVEIIIVLLCLVFSVTVAYFGTTYAWGAWQMNMMSAESSLIVPIWVFQAVIPVSFLLITLRLLGQLYDLVTGRKIPEST